MRTKGVYLNNSIMDTIRVLDRFDLDYIIAGGYPRDILMGIEPKDIDIAIYNYTDEAVVKLRDFLDSNKMLGDVYENSSSMQDRDPRIHCVIGTNKDYNLDFIFWNKSYTNYKDILRNFDVNLNQFVLLNTLVDNHYLAIFVGEDYGVLKELRGDIETTATVGRRYKMQQKALALGWKVDNIISNPNAPVFGEQL